MTELLLIRPDDVQKGSTYRYSDQIINLLRKVDEIFVVGMGSAMSLASAAVSRATSISKVSISEVTIDYIGAPKLGIGGVFFVLCRESGIDWDAKKKEMEKGMNLSFDRTGQLLVVSNNLPTERAIPMALSRIAESGCLKISAAGTAINREVPIALELTKGDIAKDELGIALVVVFSTKYTRDGITVPETVMEIFITKGKKPLSKKHDLILKLLTNG